jgi:iron complex transport system substrate-binding protein
MRRSLAALLTAAALAGPVAAAEPPRRIVSINLCADQLLLALADPGQIVGLSAFAHDAGMSFLADKARPYPQISGSAETVYALKPDLVVSGTFSNQLTNAFLKDKGVPTIVLEPVDGFDDMRAEVRLVAEAVGHPERGEAMIAALDAAIARAAAVRPAAPLRTVSLSRRGWVTGTRTLESDLLDAVGIVNAAADFGIADFGGTVGLEQLIAADLDVVLLEADSIAAEDQGSALLRHPAIAEAFPPEKRIVIPGPLTLCGGPGVIAALDRLAAEVAALRR